MPVWSERRLFACESECECGSLLACRLPRGVAVVVVVLAAPGAGDGDGWWLCIAAAAAAAASQRGVARLSGVSMFWWGVSSWRKQGNPVGHDDCLHQGSVCLCTLHRAACRTRPYRTPPCVCHLNVLTRPQVGGHAFVEMHTLDCC